MKGLKILGLLVVLMGISWGVYECKYHLSYQQDLADRPWAYSEDKTAKLLVGSWEGEFRDPDGVRKTFRLEILEPVTDEERAEKASRRARRRSGLGPRKDKQRFDGFATVSSKLGIEEYEIDGAVGKDDWHQLKTVHFQALDENRRVRKNFNVQSGLEGGQWQGDQLTFTLMFTYATETGSNYSSSADPRYDKKVTLHLLRVKS